MSAGSTTSPPTTAPGAVVTIVGGPSATANIPGPHNDPGDFYGIGIALAVILLAIGLTRVVFRRSDRRRPGSGPTSTER